MITVDSASRAYTYLSFSTKEEGKYLASLTAGPTFKIILWEWDKVRARANIEVTGFQMINQMFFHSQDDNIFVLGQANNPLKVYTLKNDKSEIILHHKADAIKDMIKHYCNNFISYCMLPENNMIIGTEEGELLY